MSETGPERPSKADLEAAIGPLTDEDYCQTCGYPLRNNACEVCERAKAEKIKAAERAKTKAIECLGGQLAFDTYKLETLRPTKINTTALAFAERFHPGNHSWYIHGPAGTGKSHLAIATARRFLGHHWTVRVVKAADIYREVRQGSRQDPAAEQAAVRRFVNIDVLVIDDLGVGKETEYSLAILYEVIDSRIMDNRNGLIVTSNLSLNSLASKLGDDRITSRLVGHCILTTFKGEKDFRFENRKGKTEK